MDHQSVSSVEEVAGWAYLRALEADLDGDGAAERVILAADVETTGSGEPLWGHGHRWAVFVEGLGVRTLLYAALVPNGHAESAVLDQQDGRREVLVLERSRHQVRVLTISYEGPGRAKLTSAAYYQVEGWLPSLAR